MINRIRLRQFTHRKPIPDVQITPREWKLDPEAIIKHDDLSASAWECEYEQPIFDNDCDSVAITSSPEITVRSDIAVLQTNDIPGTIPESSPKIFPMHIDCVTERIRIIIWSVMRNRVWISLTLHPPTPAAQSMIYLKIQNQIAFMITDMKLLIRPTVVCGTHTYTSRNSTEGFMEMLCATPAHSSKLLATFLRKLSSTED